MHDQGYGRARQYVHEGDRAAGSAALRIVSRARRVIGLIFTVPSAGSSSGSTASRARSRGVLSVL